MHIKKESILIIKKANKESTIKNGRRKRNSNKFEHIQSNNLDPHSTRTLINDASHPRDNLFEHKNSLLADSNWCARIPIAKRYASVDISNNWHHPGWRQTCRPQGKVGID